MNDSQAVSQALIAADQHAYDAITSLEQVREELGTMPFPPHILLLRFLSDARESTTRAIDVINQLP